MDISAVTWRRLSSLLDEALDLEDDARAAWVERLAKSEPELAPMMQKLLAAHEPHETIHILDSPPRPLHGQLRAGDRVGPYRLKRELGSGGMADVWLAERADGAFAREVALKLPRASGMRRGLAARFARERDILARLEQPHIARLYDAGVTDDGLAYMAMEYVAGEPITAWCDARRLNVTARLRLFAQVLDAVQYAHANLVIHRDLKPSNILVTTDGEVRLLDFGIAKLLHEESARETELTQLSGRALTPDYASPEQICGGVLTIVTDIYSLGVVLYELLSGQRPYRLKLQSAAQLEQAIVAIDPSRPSAVITDEAANARSATMRQLARSLAGDLDIIILKALDKAPAERYATVAELAADIARHLAGEAVRARPASWRNRAWKFVVRNQLAVGTAATVAIALFAAAGVSLWQAQRARDQAARADEVKRFVVSFFEAADIERGASRKTSAVDMLAQARERLAGAPITDNAARVELLTTIGSGLGGFGEGEQAEVVLEQATKLASEKLGDADRDTAIARVQYGHLLVERGRTALAKAQFDAAEPTLRRSGDMLWLAVLLRGRARLHANAGEYDTAIDLAQQSIRAGEQQPPPMDKRVLLAAYQELAIVIRNADRKGALAPARRAYEIAREIYGDRPTALLLDAQTTYAFALGDEGDAEAALTEMKAVLRSQTDMFGTNSSEVASTWRRMGTLQLALGDAASAVASFREVVRVAVAHSAGKPTNDVAVCRLNLGSVYANGHRWEEALAEWREADRIYTTLEGSEYPGARISRSGAALALTKLARLSEADSVFAALIAHPYSNPIEEAFIKGRLGLLRSAQGRHVDAEALLSDTPAFFADNSTVRQRALSLGELGYVRVAADRNAAALEVLNEARELLLKTQRNGSPDLADIDVSSAQALLALGRFDDAAAAIERTVLFWQRFDPDGRDHAVALLWQARVLAAKGDAVQAADVLRQSGDILASAGLPGDKALFERTRSTLALAKH
jgi:serine/threonine-protein kinase